MYKRQEQEITDLGKEIARLERQEALDAEPVSYTHLDVYKRQEYKMWGNGVALPNVYFVLSGIVYSLYLTDYCSFNDADAALWVGLYTLFISAFVFAVG